MIIKDFTIIKTNNDQHIFDRYKVNEEGLVSPILWCREGEFRLIPKEIIANLLDLIDICTKSSSTRVHPELQIMWSQGIPINNAAGRALLGE